MVMVAAFATSPAHAWKPKTHILAANIAVQSVLDGNDYVTIQGHNYAVDPRVAEAIRNHPDFYRAGVAGPDLYPDMYIGQGFIHPDNKLDNGSNPPGNFSAGHSFSYEWLRHIFEGAWQYYNDHSGDSEGQKILAFGYGFMTHAAGDMWAHTLVNSFAKGWFPAWTDIAHAGISIRHIVFESGYMGRHTPDTNINIAHDDATLSDFIYWDMIAGGKEGGFIDSANNDTLALGRGILFGFFFDLRWGLYDRSEALQGLGPLNPIYILTAPLWAYMDAWVDDIDAGLKAWPDVSQKIGQSLVGTEPMDWDGAGGALSDFAYDHLISMLGVPDFVAEIMSFISDIMDAFFELAEPIIEPLKDAVTDFAYWAIKMATGIDVEELKEYILDPTTWINSPIIGFDPDTQLRIDTLMGITPGSDEKFDPEAFKAFKNTVTTSKLVLMTPDALNQMLYDHRVGPMYQSGSLYSDRDNFMLGFIRTLDGHEQWRKGTDVAYENSPIGSPMGEGMPIWTDCLARDRVFRDLFEPWDGQNFDDNGEAAEDISATPPPTSTVSVLGAQYSTGGVTFIGGTSKIRISSSPDHFWNADEISVDGSIAPGSISGSGASAVDLGPITDGDGVYTVTYNAQGDCISGAPHGETAKTAQFTVDATPPTVDITPPAAGLILDVAPTPSTTLFNFTATDGGSGVASKSATLDGTPILDGATIDAFFLNAGFHTLTAVATDNIGNEGTTSRQFRVSATIPGLKAAMDRGYLLKLVTIPKKDNPYQTKLDSAAKALAAGKISTAKQNLSSLVNQLTKYVGSGLDPAFGNRYIGWVNDLISRL